MDEARRDVPKLAAAGATGELAETNDAGGGSVAASSRPRALPARSASSSASAVDHADARALARDLLEKRQIAALPDSADAAFARASDVRWVAIRAVHAAIGQMFCLDPSISREVLEPEGPQPRPKSVRPTTRSFAAALSLPAGPHLQRERGDPRLVQLMDQGPQGKAR